MEREREREREGDEGFAPFKRGTKTMSRCSRKSRVSGNLDDDDNDLLIRPGWPGTSIRSQREKKACLLSLHLSSLSLPLSLSFSLSSRGDRVVFVPGRWHVSFLFAAATRRGALGRWNRMARRWKRTRGTPRAFWSPAAPSDRRLTHPRGRLTSYLLTARMDNANGLPVTSWLHLPLENTRIRVVFQPFLIVSLRHARMTRDDFDFFFQDSCFCVIYYLGIERTSFSARVLFNCLMGMVWSRLRAIQLIRFELFGSRGRASSVIRPS